MSVDKAKKRVRYLEGVCVALGLHADVGQHCARGSCPSAIDPLEKE